MFAGRYDSRMAHELEISSQTARRFVLGRHGLWPGRRWAGKDGAREAMFAGEYLQLDPLAILARSHDLVLHSRVSGYEPQHFDEITYHDRLFFEWGGWLAARPMEELPYWRVVMRRERNHDGLQDIARDHAAVIAEMRNVLRERGTVANSDFASEGPALDHYRGGKTTSLALYYLWRTGEAMTHHRERFVRVYAPAEAVAPPHLLAEAPEEEADAFLARKSVAFAGIGRVSRIGMPLRRLLARPVVRSDQTALEQRLIDGGVLTRVTVEGWKGSQFVLTEDLPNLEAIAGGGVPAAWQQAEPGPSVALLSPLDPVSARGRAATLFGFDYMWEIYLPVEKMQYGRYSLPILFGDALVGRVDMKLERKTSTLVVNGIWMEDGTTARDDDFRAAFAAEIVRLAAFVGATAIDATAVTRNLRPLFPRFSRRPARDRSSPAK